MELELEIDNERLQIVGWLITELRAWGGQWVLSSVETMKMAESWYPTLAAIPTEELVRRDPKSLAEEMKRSGYTSGPQLLNLWDARQGSRAQTMAARRLAVQRAEAAREYVPHGEGHDRLLALGASLGWKGVP